ncbi:MAG: bifunctional ADP-dependent NAD(P)H-hydrate dehydratase/NAD(P)H-hydrate epimerase [Gammaproteobacteria bacterium]|nr:MAG: bifunctional ADP-dependent NAD(P)H-hydrate dehydratase/NAD(P)H-hydrate epimerase [Gammaproteobacteria bacterium]
MNTDQLPAELFLARQVREMDRYVIDRCFIPGISLMESAGEEGWRLLQRLWPDAGRVSVFCGPGNNGGDGYVLARLAREAGLDVTLHSSGDPEKLLDDAATARDRWLDAGGDIQQDVDVIDADVIVDALLGTGLDRPVKGTVGNMIDEINAARGPVLALDIPSGLNADTGKIMGRAVNAHATISFIGLKQGLFTGDGPEVCGDIVYASLDAPQEALLSQKPPATIYRPARPLLPRRPRNAHKGQFGHALLVGGDNGYSGAIRLAGEACLRTGAGLVSIASRAQHAPCLNLGRPELMCHGVEDGPSLKALMQKAGVIAIGPGLGRSGWASDMLAAALDSHHTLVVDADALNLLAQDPTPRENWILTPHPGEAARLLGCSVEEIQQDRYGAVSDLQKKYDGVVLLKGAGTLVSDGQTITVNTTGNPGMASGGMGDVLTGIIAALLAQGLSPANAARGGAWLHGAAADDAATAGETGMLASDLMPFLQNRLNTA